MEEIHIAGTGIWYPDEIITNDEIVSSFNSYVDEYNLNNQEDINSGKIEALEHSHKLRDIQLLPKTFCHCLI